MSCGAALEEYRLCLYKPGILVQAMLIEIKNYKTIKKTLYIESDLQALTNYMWLEGRVMTTGILKNQASERHFNVPKSNIFLMYLNLSMFPEECASGVGCLKLSTCFNFPL